MTTPAKIELELDFDSLIAHFPRGVGPEGEGGERITVEDLIIHTAARQLLANRLGPDQDYWGSGRSWVEKQVNNTLVSAIANEVNKRVSAALDELLGDEAFKGVVAEAVKGLTNPQGGTLNTPKRSVLEGMVGAAVEKQLQNVGREAVEQVRQAAMTEGSRIASESLLAAAKRLAGS